MHTSPAGSHLYRFLPGKESLPPSLRDGHPASGKNVPPSPVPDFDCVSNPFYTRHKAPATADLPSPHSEVPGSEVPDRFSRSVPSLSGSVPPPASQSDAETASEYPGSDKTV